MVGEGIFNADFAASDGAERQKRNNLMMVGIDRDRAALELLNPGYRQLAGAKARDFCPHRDEGSAEILDMRLARCIEQHRFTFRQHRGHDEIFCRRHRHIIGPVAAGAKTTTQGHG